MHRARVPFVLLVVLATSLALLAAGGCASEQSSTQCKDVCRRQAKCVDQMSEARAERTGNPTSASAGDTDQGGAGEDEDDDRNKFDTNECVAACTALERDSQGKKLVKKHMDCARAAKDCTALLACQ